MDYNPKTGAYEQKRGFNFGNFMGYVPGWDGLKNTFAQMKGATAAGQPWWSPLWSKAGGIKVSNIGKMSNIGSGIGQGIQAIGNLKNISDTSSNISDLRGDILTQYSSNPLANYYLTPDQKQMIRQIKRGTYDDGGSSGILKGIGSGLLGTVANAGIGYLTGGIPGAIIGGVGGLVNSGMQGYNQAQQSKASELEALYQALNEANMQYQSMKRIPMSGLGLQQRYVNMYQ
jgi:hypothetical protein